MKYAVTIQGPKGTVARKIVEADNPFTAAFQTGRGLGQVTEALHDLFGDKGYEIADGTIVLDVEVA